MAVMMADVNRPGDRRRPNVAGRWGLGGALRAIATPGATQAPAMRARAWGSHPATVAFLEPPTKEPSAAITRLQDSVHKSLTDLKDRALFDDVGAERKTCVDVRARVAAACKARPADEGNQIVNGPMMAVAKAHLDAIVTLQAHVQATAEAKERDAKQASRVAQAMLLALA
jgi:hypothetical protein